MLSILPISVISWQQILERCCLQCSGLWKSQASSKSLKSFRQRGSWGLLPRERREDWHAPLLPWWEAFPPASPQCRRLQWLEKGAPVLAWLLPSPVCRAVPQLGEAIAECQSCLSLLASAFLPHLDFGHANINEQVWRNPVSLKGSFHSSLSKEAVQTKMSPLPALGAVTFAASAMVGWRDWLGLCAAPPAHQVWVIWYMPWDGLNSSCQAVLLTHATSCQMRWWTFVPWQYSAGKGVERNSKKSWL